MPCSTTRVIEVQGLMKKQITMLNTELAPGCDPQPSELEFPSILQAVEASGIGQEASCEELPRNPPCVGDIVIVSRATGSSSTTAVVTKVHDKHCTAVTLENDTAHTTGEVWPFFEDLQIKNSSFRLGARVCVKGLRKPEMQPLNDAFGTIAMHPSQGHPVFVTKRNAAAGVLTYCVRLDQKTAGKKTVLLEPQFLVSEEQVLLEAENHLFAALQLLVPNVQVATDPVDTDSAATPEKEACAADTDSAATPEKEACAATDSVASPTFSEASSECEERSKQNRTKTADEDPSAREALQDTDQKAHVADATKGAASLSTTPSRWSSSSMMKPEDETTCSTCSSEESLCDSEEQPEDECARIEERQAGEDEDEVEWDFYTYYYF